MTLCDLTRLSLITLSWYNLSSLLEGYKDVCHEQVEISIPFKLLPPLREVMKASTSTCTKFHNIIIPPPLYIIRL